MTRPQLILASGSLSRRTMLAAAGLDFMTVVPDIDEDALHAKMPPELAGDGRAVAEHLAERKAIAVSASHPQALVLGCDQVLVCEGRLFTKAMDAGEAGAALRALRARPHELISAAVIATDRKPVWRFTDVATLAMRDFSEAFLEQYLSKEIPDVLGSVGCYRIEGRGAQLFDRVDGDQFTIRGLPLIPLLAELRARGALST